MDFMGIIKIVERGVTALEKIADNMTAGQQIPGVYNWEDLTPEAQKTLESIDATSGTADAEAAEAKKRTRVSQAMRDEAKGKAEAAGVLEAAEKELGPWMKWGSKDCEKAAQMALAATTGAPAPTAEPAAPTPPAGPAPGTSPVNMEDRKARFATLCGQLMAKCTPQEGEALVNNYLRMVCDDQTVTPGRFVSRADFEERLADFKVKADSTPINPTIYAAQAPAVEPEVLPPATDAAFVPTPENARRIAYLEQFAPVGEKFTQQAKDLVIQLLREGKPLGKEDARVFCVAGASYNKPPKDAVVACIAKAFNPPVDQPSVDKFGEEHVLPFIDLLIAESSKTTEAF